MVPAWEPPREVSRDEVIWAYRVLLERNPENLAVVDQKRAGCRSLYDLRSDILRSGEYAVRNPDTALQGTPTVVIAEVPGIGRMFLDLSDRAIALEILRGRYEPVVAGFVRGRLAPGMRVVDLGAHIGFYTLLASHRVGPGGKVVALEPVPGNAALLARSLAENQLAGGVEVREAAAGEATGPGRLATTPGTPGASDSGGAFLVAPGHTPAGMEVTEVTVLAVDDLELPHVDLVKADVGGAEALALRGARRLLARDHPTIVCTLDRAQLALVSHCTPRDLIAELGQLGYEARQVLQAGDEDSRGLGPVVVDVSDAPETLAFVPA